MRIHDAGNPEHGQYSSVTSSLGLLTLKLNRLVPFSGTSTSTIFPPVTLIERSRTTTTVSHPSRRKRSCTSTHSTLVSLRVCAKFAKLTVDSSDSRTIKILCPLQVSPVVVTTRVASHLELDICSLSHSLRRFAFLIFTFEQFPLDSPLSAYLFSR